MFRLRMQEGTPLRDHLENLNKILLDLRNVEVKVEDEDVALIPLVSLPELYENFVELFMTGKETLSLEDVRSALHIREDRQQATSPATESQASGLSATGTGQKKSGKKKWKSKGGSKGFQPGDICTYCKEPRHWKYDCPKKKKKGDANGSATVAEADDSDSEVSLALVADDQPHSNDVWIFDSGASYHLCPHTDYFTTYEQIDGGNITMANSVVCKVVGIGSIRIRTHDGVFCTLNNVTHVVLTALKRDVGRVYDKAMAYEAWSHGERGMQILSKRDFLSGHKVKNLDFCEHCVFGKLHRNKFPKKVVHRTKGTLDYIHMDCCITC
ncbi:hypothetical protein SASPL_152337 [Salvia splendens]|uniref:CCHC-type domain-containing protein n=1 Tax=Salvia splendens TaxID=180675 RepID=A0A8X8Z168_SALSN|nr:hypothetical protein SASPL_152337 [Salvia splendens]